MFNLCNITKKDLKYLEYYDEELMAMFNLFEYNVIPVFGRRNSDHKALLKNYKTLFKFNMKDFKNIYDYIYIIYTHRNIGKLLENTGLLLRNEDANFLQLNQPVSLICFDVDFRQYLEKKQIEIVGKFTHVYELLYIQPLFKEYHKIQENNDKNSHIYVKIPIKESNFKAKGHDHPEVEIKTNTFIRFYDKETVENQEFLDEIKNLKISKINKEFLKDKNPEESKMKIQQPFITHGSSRIQIQIKIIIRDCFNNMEKTGYNHNGSIALFNLLASFNVFNKDVIKLMEASNVDVVSIIENGVFKDAKISLRILEKLNIENYELIKRLYKSLIKEKILCL